MAAEPSDAQLLLAWREGDGEAGNVLVRRHFRSIFTFLRSKAPDQVEELVQATFLACVEARERIDETRSFRAYLFGIARRQLIYYYRRAKRDGERFDPMLQSVHDLAGSPSQVVAIRQEQEQVLTALRSLPFDLQVTLELHYWEELSVAETAVVLEVPPGTVKSRLHRAREQLRIRLEQLGAPATVLDSSTVHLRGLAGSLAPEKLP